MKNRIKQIRESQTPPLTQEQFGKRVGLSRNFVWMLERGEREASDRTIRDICKEFRVNETWLRTGAGEMLRPRSDAAELGELVRSRMIDAPDDFQAALVRLLLRLEPNGPELTRLRQFCEELLEETKKDPEP